MKLLRVFVGLLAIVVTLCICLGVVCLWKVLRAPGPVVKPSPVFAVEPVSGAALIYNRAFAAMPELNDADKKLLSPKLDQPLDTAAATKLVGKYETGLKLLIEGTKQSACVWGLDLNRGPGIPLPHLGKGMNGAKVLLLRARLHFETGDVSAATDDLLTEFRFGHHLDEPPLLICNLVQISLDSVAIHVAARYLPELDEASLKKLSDGIASLPPEHSMREAVALEKKMLPGFNRLVTEEAERRAMRPWFERLKGWISSKVEPDEFLELLRKSPAMMPTWVDGLAQNYDELEKLMSLPYAEGKPKIDALVKRVKDHARINPIAAAVLPIPASERTREIHAEAQWTILRTSLAAQLHNPPDVRAQLAKLRDPFDGGPIEMRDVPGGVELSLKSEEGKKPVTLMVGL